MPLHDKKPFERKKPPRDLRDDEEVFYCPLTKEIFRDYEEYCERIILCNSLVWSCSYTGRPCLTFEEALKSEETARQNLRDFPMELKIPVLYLASKTQRTGIMDLVEDVYIYVRDRYFVGETVEVCLNGGTWVDAYILQVCAPNENQIANSPEKNGEVKDKQRQFRPHALLYTYEVELLDGSADVSETHVVQASQVRRKPRVYSRERNRLFLKQFLEDDMDGILRLKESEMQKYKIRQVKFEQIFAGSPPEFPSSRRAVKRLQQHQLLLTKGPKRKYTRRVKPDEPSQGKKSRQETMQKYLTVTKKSPSNMVSGEKPMGATSPQKSMALKARDKFGKGGLPGRVRRKRSVFESPQAREAMRIKAIEDKKKRREDMLKERAAKREKKQELAKFIREWNRQREDLECEDLKSLPAPVPVRTKLPNKLFGDMLMVMEFLHWFSEPLKVKNFFPCGLTLDLLERALTETEITGPLSEVLQMLLSNLFEMQEDEEDALADANPAELTERTGGVDEGDFATSEALRLATAAAAWSQTYQGLPLSKVVLDSVTLTEVLRLHLLQSGGRAGEMSTEWRYRERGGYTTRDDPGLVFKLENPHILKSLSTTSVFDLPSEDKLSILTCLTNQILTYVAMRDVIEERMDKTKQIRVELHYADREISKKEKEMVEQSRKKRKKLIVPGNEEQKVEDAEESDVEEEKQETQEEKTARLAREKKLTNEKMKELQKRRNQLADEMMGHTNLPVGCDRAHRRFWLFASLPGLFVENDERFAGSCLAKPTPHNLDLVKTEDTLSYVCKLFEEERHGGSDKENDGDVEMIPAPLVGSPNKKLLAEKNHKSVGSPLKAAALQLQQGEESAKATVTHAAMLTCNADPDSCPVHSTKVERVTWGFYMREQLDELIERLSTRGIRESELRTALVQGKDRVTHSLEQCPVSKLNPDEADDTHEIRKSQRQKDSNLYKDTLLGHPVGTPLEQIQELTLRDLILEMEEKITAGGLGTLKVTNRQAWRETIMARSYDKECDKLVWPGMKEEGDAVSKIKSERISRPGTPDSTASYSRDPSCYARLAAEVVNLGSNEIQPQQGCVHDLACAILQVSQSIDDRYLQKPLGLDVKERERKKEKEKKEDDTESEKEKDTGLTALHRWQVSLMASTSFSQLFLHFSTLDNSIQWTKSALNARCKLCRRRGDPEAMLLCDGCNKGHHMYCLKPKITNVPKGDWFCPSCKPKEKKKPPKKRKALSDDEEEEEDRANRIQVEEKSNALKESCKSCGKDETELQCEKCNKCFHLECHDPPIRKAPRGKWMCEKCKNRVANSKRASENSNEENLVARRRSRRSLDVDGDELPLDNAALQELLEDIIKHKDAWAFTRPVLKSEVPDYHQIIKRPMDFGKIKHKLNMLEYRNTSEVLADALLVFENCEMYNQADTEVYKSGIRLRKYFEKRCRDKNLKLKEEDIRQPELKKKRIST